MIRAALIAACFVWLFVPGLQRANAAEITGAAWKDLGDLEQAIYLRGLTDGMFLQDDAQNSLGTAYAHGLLDCLAARATLEDLRTLLRNFLADTPDAQKRPLSSTMLSFLIHDAERSKCPSVKTVSKFGPRDAVTFTYWKLLDDWVERGAPTGEIQKVVGICGKLVIANATPDETRSLQTTGRTEWDDRVDVCVQLTTHRSHPQPWVRDSKLVASVCDAAIPLYKQLCQRAGLRK